MRRSRFDSEEGAQKTAFSLVSGGRVYLALFTLLRADDTVL